MERERECESVRWVSRRMSLLTCLRVVPGVVHRFGLAQSPVDDPGQAGGEN